MCPRPFGEQERESNMTSIRDTVCGLDIGGPVAFQNLTMFPLLGGDTGRGDYLTLDEALAQKLVRITEVNESGSVPELRFVNEGDRQVLLVDGEELVGAKQNRTLNITILAPAHSVLPLPVTCVEAGRWAHASAEFASASRSHYAAGRAQKNASVSESLRTRGDRMADQGEVWADIDAKAMRLSSHSETHAMADMYEQNVASVEGFVEGLPAQAGQRGAIFAIGGEVIGCDLFDCAATLAKLLPKIVRSYALDAVDSASAQDSSAPAPSTAAALAMRDRIAAAETTGFPAVGLGEDFRLQAAGLAGGALVVDGRVVHLGAFAIAAAEAEEGVSALSRASTRRRYRMNVA